MKKIISLLALAACTPDIEAYRPLSVAPARDLDILFVIDDSADRGRYDQMTAQIDALSAQLSTVDGQLPSLHVGVVTTDLGTSATDDPAPFRPTVPGCFGEGKAGALQRFAAGIGDDYLEDLRAPDGSRTKNYTGDLSAELAKLTNPSTLPVGCEFEQPFEAMRRALDPATNPGFVRDGALLSVVFLTNEDDCSLKKGALLEPLDASLGPLSSFRCTEQGVVCDLDDPRRDGAKLNCRPRESSPFVTSVGEYEAFLASIKDRDDVVVSAVAGPRTPFIVRDFGQPVLAPSCAGAGTSAVPAVRIGALVDAFGGTLSSACEQAAAYERLTQPIVGRQRSCLASLPRAEVDACSVLEIDGDTETELDRCAEGDAGPCWYSFTDAAACPGGENVGIAIRRGSAAPASTRIEARCFVP